MEGRGIAVFAGLFIVFLSQGRASNSYNYQIKELKHRRCLLRSLLVFCPNMRNRFILRRINHRATDITLRNNNLKRLPFRHMRRFKQLKYLDASDNLITSLKRSLSGNVKLTVLDMSKNKIGINVGYYDEVLASAFKHNRLLHTVNIRENNIKKLSSRIVGRRNHMSKFDVSMNEIWQIKMDTFSKMKYLTILNLSKNKIRNIHKHSFKFNRKIEHLDLSGNEISLGGKASQITLFNNKRLKTLLLSDNKLTTLSEINYQKNQQLENLDVSLNQIRHIHDYDVTSNWNLLYLNLSYNHVEEIDIRAFASLHSLKLLDLTANNLRYIHPHHFQNLNNLQTLLLGKNLLSVIPEEMLARKKFLSYVDLRLNSMNRMKMIIKNIRRCVRILTSSNTKLQQDSIAMEDEICEAQEKTHHVIWGCGCKKPEVHVVSTNR